MQRDQMKKPFLTDWFQQDVPPQIKLNEPGIYEWRIDGAVYIGKSKRLLGRLREYPNNVRKLVEGLPYRKHRPDGFRAVHRHLHIAYKGNAAISVKVLENCEPDCLNEREQFWIDLRRREEKSGGPRVLNSD